MYDLGNVFILGDSYSTYKDFIPSGYTFWYSEDTPKPTDVRKVEYTWWHLLLNNVKGKLVRNDSWSGTTICNTGYHGADNSSNSFLTRLKRLVDDGFFKENKIDTFIIFGGTNDSWAVAPIGQLKYSDFNDTDYYSVLPAFCKIANLLKTNLPDARIIAVINTELRPAIEQGFTEACNHFGIETVKPEEISKSGGHPDIKGMRQISDTIIKHLQNT